MKLPEERKTEIVNEPWAGMNDKHPKRRISNVRHPDFQMIDEVRIRLVERWKESGLSGDEWRFAGEVQLLFKGAVVHSHAYGNLKAAIMGLGHQYLVAGDDGMQDEMFRLERECCAQPACCQKATVFFRVKATYHRDGTKTELPPSHDPGGLYVIGFCEQHRRRGDCGLQDSDANYEEIPNPRATP